MPNRKPEKQVEFDVITWCMGHGLAVDVVESKATFSRRANRYLRGNAPRGMPDLVGNDYLGRSAWIELKAPGRLSTLRLDQYQFLMKKIQQGCFAVVVDSVKRLEEYRSEWLKLIDTNAADQAQEYLREILPVPKGLKVVEP